MSLNCIISGDYGQIIVLNVYDCDTSAAADISSYSTAIQMQFKDPANNTSIVTAAFYSDGTSGGVKYTYTTTDIDEPGRWKIRAIVTSGSAKLSSEWAEFNVLD